MFGYGIPRKGLWLWRCEGSGARWQLWWLEDETVLRLLTVPVEAATGLEQELGPRNVSVESTL